MNLRKHYRRGAIAVLAAAALTIGALSSCQLMGGSGGSVALSIADDPITGTNVTGVYIGISKVEAQVNGSWQTVLDFSSSPKVINLLNFSNGKSDPLGGATIPAGKITALRFDLAIAQSGSATSQSYITFSNGTKQYLFVPSGSQTGFKVSGNFDLQSTGSLNLTADFNVEQMVVQTSAGYLLRPVIHLTEDSQTGQISGTASATGGASLTSLTPAKIVVYAYEKGDYSSSQTSPTGDDAPFSEAEAAATVNLSTGSFTLGNLPSGTYQLVAAGYDSSGKLLGVIATPGADITVKAGGKVTANLTVS